MSKIHFVMVLTFIKDDPEPLNGNEQIVWEIDTSRDRVISGEYNITIEVHV